MHANLVALGRSEAVQDLVVQIDEAAEETARRVELEREPALGEINLDIGCAGFESSTDIGFGFVDEISEEGFPRVAGYLRCRIQEAQSGSGDDGLLNGALCIAAGRREIAIGVNAVAERSGRQSGQLALVTVGERDHDSIGCEIFESSERVSCETGLSLLAICQDWRTGLFKAADGVLKGLPISIVEHITGDFAGLEGRNGLNQLRWAGDAANRFGRNCHPESVTGLGSSRPPLEG